MGARYYDASLGRFISEDPAFLAVGDAGQLKSIAKEDQSTYLMSPQSANSFAYARNNPMIYTDPTGAYPSWMNPIGFLPQKTQVAIGNWANGVAANNGVFDYATSHDSVGYALGGVTLAAGGGAAVLAGLGAAGITAAGSTCVAFCGKASEAVAQASPALSGNATGFLGHSGYELKNITEAARNTATEIGDRLYSGHALDQMQNRGIMPSVVENTIKNGVQFAGNNPVTTGFSDAVNRVQVITNNISNAVVTVIRGVKK
jgi:RHS repeat-associated protein